MYLDSKLPCFTGANSKVSTGKAPSVPYPATSALRDRFQLGMSEAQVCDFVDQLIDSSCNNVFTKLYDSFQYYANGILK
jgi:phosphatidylinositol 4-kinase